MNSFGSLFSGIGGFDLGFERAGFKCHWQVEIDNYCQQILKRHWPDVPKWRDVHDFIEQGCGTDVRCVVGGFPCQPVSVAGARKGERDKRWLWEAFRDVIDQRKPQYVVVENVPGLLSARDAAGTRGRLFGNILWDLAGLGFDAEWGVLPAAAFGAPHLRKRVFIVAYSDRNGIRIQSGRRGRKGRTEEPSEPGNASANRASSDSSSSRPPITEQEVVPRTLSIEEGRAAAERGGRTAQSRVRRDDDGIPFRLDGVAPTLEPGKRRRNRPARLTGLGNAVVPQVAEWIARRILNREVEVVGCEDRHQAGT